MFLLPFAVGQQRITSENVRSIRAVHPKQRVRCALVVTRIELHYSEIVICVRTLGVQLNRPFQELNYPLSGRSRLSLQQSQTVNRIETVAAMLNGACQIESNLFRTIPLPGYIRQEFVYLRSFVMLFT